MREAWAITIASLIVAGIIGLAKALFDHVKECRAVHAELAKIATAIARVQTDIGDTDSGMRGAIHEQGRALQHHGGCMWLIAGKLGIELPKRDGK